ncbi:endolytic transglycosylase MltG [Pseudolysobacter antarcticus]|uniref:Endolytic murein transglycosylase n=1 Tax=Pseudolysobacter antarcticus TaxID=2511995 RepID=A0A411HIJ3_9GAMM|nr:endolytic transglycosylase MltG [Pseudolysobacter antarcticus]QBB70234.1 endolytic transglycosylase MltG [Pseudolysobacter antarcticus]
MRFEFRRNVSKQRGGALLRLLFVVLIFGAIAAGWFYREFENFADSPLHVQGTDATLDVPLGTSLPGIVTLLKAQAASSAPWPYWRALAWQMHVTSSLHAGEYALSAELTPRSLLKRMAAGEVIQHKFTIVEGWNFKQLRLALAQQEKLQPTLAGLSDAEIMKKLGAADQAAEGQFLPETYVYLKGQPDLDVLRRAHVAMQQQLDGLWSQRGSGLPLESPYQALILASIVEKETGRAEERPQIAGVFMRRLKIGMRLQTDPSVIYGLGDNYDGNIHRRDLDTDTPYNTYTRSGLPPTPIALPGKAALAAVMHPAPGNSLYFVARGDGTHQFSDTLEAHNSAVGKFQLGKKQ